MLNIYSREITHMCRDQFLSRNLQSRINPNPDVIVVSPSSERENPIQNNKYSEDPFIIKKNYRMKKYNNNCLMNSDNPEKKANPKISEEYHEMSERKNHKPFNEDNEKP